MNVATVAVAGYVCSLLNENQEGVILKLLNLILLLSPGNSEAKLQYLKLIPEVLRFSAEHAVCIEESRQLLSYCLIHPAFSIEDRKPLTVWLRHLEVLDTYQQRAVQEAQRGGCLGYVDVPYHSNITSWQSQDAIAQTRQNGSLAGQVTTSLPAQGKDKITS